MKRKQTRFDVLILAVTRPIHKVCELNWWVTLGEFHLHRKSLTDKLTNLIDKQCVLATGPIFLLYDVDEFDPEVAGDPNVPVCTQARRRRSRCQRVSNSIGSDLMNCTTKLRLQIIH